MNKNITISELQQFLHSYWKEAEIGKEVDKIFIEKEEPE